MGTSVVTKPISFTKRPIFTLPFYYVKVPNLKNELTHVHVGQKTSLHTKNKVSGSKTGNFSFFRAFKKGIKRMSKRTKI